MSDVRHRQIAVHDGRNRAMLTPFATKTGRNAPGGQFLFTAGSWMRGFIKPPAGRAIAYLDYRAQEVAVAAVLSGDLAMLQAYSSGDPYLRFAVMAGLAPEGASKASHGPIRDVCKVAVLGANYGMREKALAAQTGVSTAEAEFILRRLRDTWPIYDAWATRQIDIGYLLGRMQTRHGWRMVVTGPCSSTQLRNWMMQSSGADMLRLAVLRARRGGIEVAAPVHDALVIEADAGAIEDAVETTVKAMQDASADVLRGFRVDVERKIVQWPGRYMDPRGEFMWNKVNALLTA